MKVAFICLESHPSRRIFLYDRSCQWISCKKMNRRRTLEPLSENDIVTTHGPPTLCYPLGNPNADCCFGGGEGAKCIKDTDCLGLSYCSDGICNGPSGCREFCNRRTEDGKMINCCVPEAAQLHKCTTDDDCLGARTCDPSSGVCTGDSGCKDPANPQVKIIYDAECLCLGVTGDCLFPDGVPCSSLCYYERSGNIGTCLATI